MMDIPAKLMEFRYHLGIAVIVTMVTVSLFHVAPQFLTILAYFWPLFLSTAVLLVSIIVFGGVSSIESHGEKAGEGLIDYVAGQPEYVELPQKYE